MTRQVITPELVVALMSAYYGQPIKEKDWQELWKAGFLIGTSCPISPLLTKEGENYLGQSINHDFN